MADFEINGVAVKKPSTWNTVVQTIAKEGAKRLQGSGKMMAEYMQSIPVTKWTYKIMTQEEFDVLYNQYIVLPARNKEIFVTVKTIDSNTGRSITYTANKQGELNSGLYRIANGKRVYHNVVLDLVGQGGDDSWLTL